MRARACGLALLAVCQFAAGAGKGKVPAGTPTPPPARGDAVAGKEKAEAERCFECHGSDGMGAGHPNSAEAKFPKLAGLSAAYILKQIGDFRSGARKHDQMQIVARAVADEDLPDIAAYFAALPPMGKQGGPGHALGQTLFENGAGARVSACVSCHGPAGKGLADTPLVPQIGGQEWRYLDKQLRDWRSGERRNSAKGVMSEAARALSDAEIEALADFLAEQ